MARSSDADAESEEGRRGSTSVLLNGLGVLEAFTIAEPILGVTEIARRVGLHKSSVSRILATLEQAGYVERVPGDGRFRLGLGLIALAGPLLADLDVRRLARPTLERLVETTEETAALMLWDGHGAVVTEQVPSSHPVKHTAPLGTRWTSHLTASVQAFAAHLPARQIEPLLGAWGLAGVAGGDERRRYEAVLDEVRRSGYAVNDGLTSEEEVGIAAIVRDHRDDVVAAVLLSAPRFRIPPARIAEIGREVAAAAAEISARLGSAPARASGERARTGAG